MARILVTDGEQRSCLAVVRSLGRAGHHVMVCSWEPRPLAAASRYCRGVHLVPDPSREPQACRAAVEEIVATERVSVLLPMTDVSVGLLLALRDACPDLVLPFPAREAYEAISDKRRLMEVAAGVGVPVPRQHVLEGPDPSLEEAGARARELGLPVVLKPARSAVRGLAGIRKFGVRTVGSQAELADALSAYPPEAYPILLQERIVGHGLGAFALAEGGTMLAVFAHRRLREKPPTGGVSVYRESVAMRQDVRAHAERILEHFGWTGVAMVEFKEDAASGTPYLMEVNGRFWGSLQLAIDAGVDFPVMLVRSALGERVAESPSYRVGIRSRWFWGDVDHLLWMTRAGREVRGAHPALPGRWLALGRFLVPWRPGDRFEVMRMGDPLPFLRESAQWFRKLGS